MFLVWLLIAKKDEKRVILTPLRRRIYHCTLTTWIISDHLNGQVSNTTIFSQSSMLLISFSGCTLQDQRPHKKLSRDWKGKSIFSGIRLELFLIEPLHSNSLRNIVNEKKYTTTASRLVCQEQTDRLRGSTVSLYRI